MRDVGLCGGRNSESKVLVGKLRNKAALVVSVGRRTGLSHFDLRDGVIDLAKQVSQIFPLLGALKCMKVENSRRTYFTRPAASCGVVNDVGEHLRINAEPLAEGHSLANKSLVNRTRARRDLRMLSLTQAKHSNTHKKARETSRSVSAS